PVGGGTLYDLAHALLPILAVPPDAGTPCPEARARNRSKPHLLADRDDSEKGRSGCEATEIPIFAGGGGEQGPGILVPGLGEYLGARTVFDHAPLVHHRDGVAHLGR